MAEEANNMDWFSDRIKQLRQELEAKLEAALAKVSSLEAELRQEQADHMALQLSFAKVRTFVPVDQSI